MKRLALENSDVGTGGPDASVFFCSFNSRNKLNLVQAEAQRKDINPFLMTIR